METASLPVTGCKLLPMLAALMAIEQWGFFSVPHLFWHGASVYDSHLRGPLTLRPFAERLVVELSLPDLSPQGFEHPTFCLRSERSNPLHHRRGHKWMINLVHNVSKNRTTLCTQYIGLYWAKASHKKRRQKIVTWYVKEKASNLNDLNTFLWVRTHPFRSSLFLRGWRKSLLIENRNYSV